jgi:hypothetical protein
MQRFLRACAVFLVLTLIVGPVGSVSLSAGMMPGAALAAVPDDMSQCPDCVDPGIAQTSCQAGCAVMTAVLAKASEARQARPRRTSMAARGGGVGRAPRPELHPPK